MTISVPQGTAEANEPALLAMIACRRGQLSLAYRLGRAALQRAEGPGGEGFATFDARLAVAEVLFEHNELEQAQELLQSTVQLCASAPASHWAAAAELDLVRLMIALERPSEALDRLGHLRHAALRDPLPCHLLKRANEVEIGCRVFLGRPGRRPLGGQIGGRRGYLEPNTGSDRPGFRKT